MKSESFPCIICGRVLLRVFEEYEGQPDDGVMCSSDGNYGSAVFDPFDGSSLAFNICDLCIVAKANEGRVMITRHARPVCVAGMGVVGWQKVESPYIPWRENLAEYDDRCILSDDDLRGTLPPSINLSIPVEDILNYLETH